MRAGCRGMRVLPCDGSTWRGEHEEQAGGGRVLSVQPPVPEVVAVVVPQEIVEVARGGQSNPRGANEQAEKARATVDASR
mmetsp:Transcript_40480/g.125549  ORF Transcript_40480/g.125549 Transcript_40480/m.125549 type:complete len:80 (+) Transcript_40480:48-287(+)